MKPTDLRERHSDDGFRCGRCGATPVEHLGSSAAGLEWLACNECEYVWPVPARRADLNHMADEHLGVLSRILARVVGLAFR